MEMSTFMRMQNYSIMATMLTHENCILKIQTNKIEQPWLLILISLIKFCCFFDIDFMGIRNDFYQYVQKLFKRQSKQEVCEKITNNQA